jgi:hypothetical protein
MLYLQLLYLYSTVTIIVYIRFVNFVGKTKRRNVQQQRQKLVVTEHAKIYFKQLEAQWQ